VSTETFQHETTRVVAGDCTVEFTGAGSTDRAERGRVVAVVKPDKTVLVHDADGYQPAAWLTRPETTFVERDPLVVTATDGDQRLRLTVHEATLDAEVPTSHAGVPVGVCPDCSGTSGGSDDAGADGAAPDGDGGVLVRARGAVHCTDCGERYGLPAGATVLDSTCECGLPTCRVTRGAGFEVCIDRECESLDDRVREAFDRAWTCPDCGDDLRILRRGGLIAGCASYPDCETGFAVPNGLAVGTCECGLPTFETAGGERCLDAACDGH
jgi:DNA topoisomerase-1